jgi:hypothetical protein
MSFDISLFSFNNSKLFHKNLSKFSFLLILNVVISCTSFRFLSSSSPVPTFVAESQIAGIGNHQEMKITHRAIQLSWYQSFSAFCRAWYV